MPQKIEGTVVSIDAAGNLVTDIAAAQLDGLPNDQSVVVRCDEHETVASLLAIIRSRTSLSWP